jgi:hypothetical protein
LDLRPRQWLSHLEFEQVLGIAPAVVQGNWMGRGGISDYASHYSDYSICAIRNRGKAAFGNSTTGCELFYSRQSLMMLERQQLFLASISSLMYLKNTRGVGVLHAVGRRAEYARL